MSKQSQRRTALKALTAPVVLALGAPIARAQAAREVKVGLLVPLSGLYARPGAVMRMGAEMAVDHINAAGGVKALGGAKLRLVVLDSGDSTEKAKNAAQRMVSQETDLVAATGAYLSSFTLAVAEVWNTYLKPRLVIRSEYDSVSTGRLARSVTSVTASVNELR